MKIITIKEFLRFDDLEKIKILKNIAKGELRIKENRKSDKNG